MSRMPMSLKAGLRAAAIVVLALAPAGADAKNWEAWSAPANLNTMSTPDINTGSVDGCASHSHDGLTIVFNSNRAGTHDLYMATRSSKSAEFGAAERLPAPVNTPDKAEACPTIVQGKRLYFASDRHDPAYDLYMSRLGPRGWSQPARLGPNINVPGMLEEAPDFFEDEDGREVMIFTRRPPGPPAGEGGKLYQSIDGGPATLVQGGPHGSAGDNRASVTKDGLAIFWDSTRFGSLGSADIWYATRSNTSEPFGAAVHLPGLSGPGLDGRPYISWDGSLLTFSSGRTGNATPAPDIWFATRDKSTGN